jgi:hypothetical protein
MNPVNLFRPIAIFNGFTFTDLADFGPLTLLIFGIILTALFKWRYSEQKWAHNFAVAFLLISILGYLTQHVYLYLFAKEFEHITGKMPVPMINDPKWLPSRFASLAPYYHRVNYAEAYAGAFSVFPLPLFFILHKRLTKWQIILMGISIAFVCFIDLSDPYRLWEWWMD